MVLCLGNPFLESGSGQAVSCPAEQLRSASGGLSGDGAQEAVPGWWQCLCPDLGSFGVELLSKGRDGW